jgi:hypothetical protein
MGILEVEVIWMTVAIMVTITSVPPVITPGAKAGRFFVFVKQTVSLRLFVATTLEWFGTHSKLTVCFTLSLL